MAIEYMPGGTLDKKIGKLSQDEAVSIACSILEALHDAHHLGD